MSITGTITDSDRKWHEFRAKYLEEFFAITAFAKGIVVTDQTDPGRNAPASVREHYGDVEVAADDYAAYHAAALTDGVRWVSLEDKIRAARAGLLSAEQLSALDVFATGWQTLYIEAASDEEGFAAFLALAVPDGQESVPVGRKVQAAHAGLLTYTEIRVLDRFAAGWRVLDVTPDA